MSWPHAPSKIVTHPGAYIVTSSTYKKEHFFTEPEALRKLYQIILEEAEQTAWRLQAWAVFSNHYHIVGFSDGEDGVKKLTQRINSKSAIYLNKRDSTPGQKVWYRSWDTRLSFEKSYLARLAYVHNNPRKHLGVDPLEFEFCSLNWFIENGDKAFVHSVLSFKTDSVNVVDDF